MKRTGQFTFTLIIAVLLVSLQSSLAQVPVNPHASPEAKALLELFYSLSGKYTLTGQHNYPATRDRNSRFAKEYSGRTPAIWSTDMGFAREGDYDSYLARPDIVREAIRQHQKGSIITICWHAVPPTADEPVTFQPRGPFPPDSLATVQGQLLDVYGSDFKQDYYDSLKVLSMGKPMLFGEVGNPPFPEILDSQPDWTSWVIWAGMVRNTTKKQYKILYDDPRILTQDDPAYYAVTRDYREACGLPVLPLKNRYPVDFSGDWFFNEDKSELGGAGTGAIPCRIKADLDGDILFVSKYNVVEWGDERIIDEEIDLKGGEMRSRSFNAPRISIASWDEDTGSLTITSTVTFSRGGNTTEMKSSEEWQLTGDGNTLTIHQVSTGFRGNRVSTTLTYEKLPY